MLHWSNFYGPMCNPAAPSLHLAAWACTLPPRRPATHCPEASDRSCICRGLVAVAVTNCYQKQNIEHRHLAGAQTDSVQLVSTAMWRWQIFTVRKMEVFIFLFFIFYFILFYFILLLLFFMVDMLHSLWCCTCCLHARSEFSDAHAYLDPSPKGRLANPGSW